MQFNHELIVMRLADMHRMHPQQDNSHVCSKCGQQVGIYPSGQKVIARYPSIQIICNVCFDDNTPALTIVAPGAYVEQSESFDVGEKQ